VDPRQSVRAGGVRRARAALRGRMRWRTTEHANGELEIAINDESIRAEASEILRTLIDNVVAAITLRIPRAHAGRPSALMPFQKTWTA
jgi:hypothetical protein